MQINLIADSSVASAPSGFAAAIQTAANILDLAIKDAITINIAFGWGTYDGTVDSSLTHATGAEGGFLSYAPVDYATAKAALSATATSAADLTAIASLPATSSALPNPSAQFYVTTAQLKAMGLIASDYAILDGAIGFGTSSTSSFWLGAALHEITHAMGRISGYAPANGPELLDLFRYSSAGTYQWTGGQPAYFSINGGTTDLANFSTVSDYGDLGNNAPTANDSFNAFVNASALTAADLTIMDAIGFNVGAGDLVSAGQSQTVGSGVTLTGAEISSGGTIVVASGGEADSTTIDSGGLLVISSGGVASGTIVHSGGKIDLAGLGFASGGSADLNAATDVLTVTESTGTVALQLSGSYIGEYFHLTNDGTGGTLITADGTPCYCRGTLILTAAGEVPVETLKIGDPVVIYAGEERPIKWIGRRSYSGRFAAGNKDVLPVRFRAGSLADGVPRRDLTVSPLHAMYLDGVLVPAWALVNGRTIEQLEQVAIVEYFHIELETHDVIWAEGAASETFLDDDSRGMFHNASDYRVLYPADTRRQPAAYCAPRVEDGEALEAIRRSLDALATPLLAARERPGELTGRLEHVSQYKVAGWAFDPERPGEPVRLRIRVNGVTVGETIADLPRRDLVSRGYGYGQCGFAFSPEGGLMMPHDLTVAVERVCDGSPLPGSPLVLKAPQPSWLRVRSRA